VEHILMAYVNEAGWSKLTKAELGGYFIIDVADLDAAVSWAARCPAAGHGIVEVRPLWAA
jgi:hypothetical protein